MCFGNILEKWLTYVAKVGLIIILYENYHYCQENTIKPGQFLWVCWLNDMNMHGVPVSQVCIIIIINHRDRCMSCITCIILFKGVQTAGQVDTHISVSVPVSSPSLWWSVNLCNPQSSVLKLSLAWGIAQARPSPQGGTRLHLQRLSL